MEKNRITRNKVKSRNVSVAAFLLAVVVVLGVIAAIVDSSFVNSNKICNGVTISGIKVGGLDKDTADRMVKDWARKKLTNNIVLVAMDRRWTSTFADLGVRIDTDSAINEALSVGRKGNIFGRALCILGSGGVGRNITTRILVDPSRVEKVVDKVARAINRPHKDASLRVVDGRLDIVDDTVGIKVDRKKSVELLKQKLPANVALVQLPIEPDNPDVTSEDASEVTVLLARYTTRFNPGKHERTHNLSLAARAVNGYLMKPGQEFSYNHLVGPRDEIRGFKNAPIFVKGKVEPGLGGGICQVSSTMYNSVLLAGLKITARSHHSRTVTYTPVGRDATVAYGARDFKFINNNSKCIGIISYVTGSHLTVDIYGAPEDRKTVRIYTGKKTYTPFGHSTVVDPTLAPGQKKRVDPGATGVSVVVYREIKDGNGKTYREVVSRDKYLPQDAVTAVGAASDQGDDNKKISASPAGNEITPAKMQRD